MKILAVIGARPQFIKHAPFEAAARNKIDLVTIHTGQHYDSNMSKVFFDQLNIKEPEYMFSTGGGNHGEQTGNMLREIEPILIKEKPDYLLVYGDTNSTLAGALAAVKLHIPIIHVESGLRSYNRSMPEEINRLLTDQISSLLFTSTSRAVENLKNEGITKGVYLVGDIMADSVRLAKKINQNSPRLYEGDYYFATIHRPYNTDDSNRIATILRILNHLNCKVIFPIHPRTRKLCASFQIDLDSLHNIEFIEPVSYFKNINYVSNAKHVITDSGGLQKEAYMLRTPCITVRSETEWNETLDEAWNVLCFDNLQDLPGLIDRKIGAYHPTLYGDGFASEQIINTILSLNEDKAVPVT